MRPAARPVAWAGSSPLARGLRLFGMRIEDMGGSSPLARGLQRLLRHRVDVRGIIPARAGFTASVSASPESSSDHPRSRGVYPPRPVHHRTDRGSSPLARGLLSTDWWDYVQDGIIPARAGFTPPTARSALRSADHPRSRGVYPARTIASRIGAGSSPLARGLPDATATIPRTTGIIPARAGFTGDWVVTTPGGWDHPRSRGVYA